VGRGAEAKQPHPLTRFDARHPKAPESDDPGAKQRSSLQIVEGIRQRDSKIRAGESVFGVPSIDGISRKDWRIAQILSAAAAECAGSVRTAEPGNAHAPAIRQFADDLMSRDHALANRPELTLHDVQIRAANAAGQNAQQNVTGRRDRLRKMFDRERTIQDRAGRGQYRGTHKFSTSSSETRAAMEGRGSFWSS
jgi:hypothetical protein